MSVELSALMYVLLFFRDKAAGRMRRILALYLVCLMVADSAFIYHYYIVGAGFPTPWISFLTEFNYAVMDLAIAGAYVLSYRAGFRNTVFKWPNIIPLVPSLPVMIRFGLPLFSHASFLQGWSFVLNEMLAILSTLVVFNLATVTFIGARQRSWTWISAGSLTMILGGWAMRVEKFMGHPLSFGIYELLWALGVLIVCGTIVFQRKWERIDSYRVRSLLCQIKLATLVLAFVSIGIIFALQNEAVIRMRFLTLATVAGILFSAWFSHFVADRIDKFTAILAGSLLRDPGIGLGEPVRLSDVPVELEDAFNKTVQVRLADYDKARTLQEEMRLSDMRLRMADQVFHDLKSPLCALEMAGELAKKLPESERNLIRHAIDRIRDITGNLPRSLTRGKPGVADTKPTAEGLHSVSHLIAAVVSERRLQLSGKNVEVEFSGFAAAYGLFIRIDRVEFMRVLSNIIGNSVEAISTKGLVAINLGATSRTIEISIADNGCGISPEHLKRVFERGFSRGKQGSGLGLYHAKQVLENYGGTIRIESEVGRGTKVILHLERQAPPQWYIPELEARESSTVVVIDDDPSIHEVWKTRFSPTKLRLTHFTQPEEALEWHRRENPQGALFLIDLEFLNSCLTGKDIHRALEGERRVLVTSRFESLAEADRSEGLLIIPKDQAGVVPIRVI
ncbi:MAG: HAMP domain-containing sensor histidine kinase [Bdellovibrionota bacterium]